MFLAPAYSSRDNWQTRRSCACATVAPRILVVLPVYSIARHQFLSQHESSNVSTTAALRIKAVKTSPTDESYLREVERTTYLYSQDDLLANQAQLGSWKLWGCGAVSVFPPNIGGTMKHKVPYVTKVDSQPAQIVTDCYRRL